MTEMQLTIKLPDALPSERMSHIVMELKKTLAKEGVPTEIEQESAKDEDAWDKLDIDAIAVDTGIEDFAENHDHYLYGLPKRS